MATYTMQELELETAELLPARETLCQRPLLRTAQRQHRCSGGPGQRQRGNNDNFNVLSGNFSGNGFLGGIGGSGNGASFSACPY